MERQILQSMLINQSDMDVFIDKTPSKVWSKEAREILKHMQELKNKNALNPNTLIATVSEDIKNSNYFIEMMAEPYIYDYLALQPQLIKNYQLEKQKDIGAKFISAAASGDLLDMEIFAKESEVENTAILNLAEWQEFYKNKPKIAKVKSGISFLDTCFSGGFEMAQLMLISGDPEAGKTMLGLQILENIARTQQVGFFCFEFTVEQYIKRRTSEAQNSPLAQNMLILNDGYDINEIARNIKTLYKRGVRVFLIDSQMRITSPMARNMEEEESLKFSALARLCHSLDIFIMLIIQTSKGDRDNPMGSKKGGHEASIIIRIERCAPDKSDVLQSGSEFDENARMILVKKNKQTGRHFKERVNFNTKSLTFSEDDINYKELEIYRI